MQAPPPPPPTNAGSGSSLWKAILGVVIGVPVLFALAAVAYVRFNDTSSGNTAPAVSAAPAIAAPVSPPPRKATESMMLGAAQQIMGVPYGRLKAQLPAEATREANDWDPGSRFDAVAHGAEVHTGRFNAELYGPEYARLGDDQWTVSIAAFGPHVAVATFRGPAAVASGPPVRTALVYIKKFLGLWNTAMPGVARLDGMFVQFDGLLTGTTAARAADNACSAYPCVRTFYPWGKADGGWAEVVVDHPSDGRVAIRLKMLEAMALAKAASRAAEP